MGMQDIVRWFLPKEDIFYRLLEQQAEVNVRAAQSLASVASRLPADVCAEVQDIEHEGDSLVKQMEAALNKTFVTPIDREDLHVRWDQVSKEVPFPPRKLKMKWSSEAAEDLHAFTGIDVSAQIDQIKEEEDESILRKIARRVGLKR